MIANAFALAEFATAALVGAVIGLTLGSMVWRRKDVEPVEMDDPNSWGT